MSKHSRRSFLKTATIAAGALTASGRVLMWAQPASPVRMWSTSGNQRHAQAEAPAWKAGGQSAAGAIVVDGSVTKQEILGFGAAMTDSSCYVLSEMKDDERAGSHARPVCARRNGSQCVPHLHRGQAIMRAPCTASTKAMSPIRA